MKISILSENRTNDPDCLAEHGLSVYIETAGRKILFDFGASDIYKQNAEQMKIDLAQVDTAVVSHGHYDHTGGVPSFCKINQKAQIYIHEKAFETTYGIENGKLEDQPCSIRWTEEKRKNIEERLVLTSGVTWLSEDIAVSGTIPQPKGYQPTEVFFCKDVNGNLTPDSMEHEQFLAVRIRDGNGKSQGIFVFSGCSHTGVMPCLEYARLIFPGEKILGLLAGMHLYHAGKKIRSEILSRLAAEGMEYVMPVHCTGINAICDLRILMGDRCIPAGAGDQYEI